MSNTIRKYFAVCMAVFFLLNHTNASSTGKFQPITKDRIERDFVDINKFVKATQAKVEKGEYWAGWTGKSAACTLGGVTEKTFDSMPTEFFKNSHGVKHVMAELTTPEAILYMTEGKQAFVEQRLIYKSDLKRDDIAEFFHNRMVDHLSVSDDAKRILKNKPLQIKQYLKDSQIKDQYMHLVGRNITIQYYVEKEWGKEAS